MFPVLLFVAIDVVAQDTMMHEAAAYGSPAAAQVNDGNRSAKLLIGTATVLGYGGGFYLLNKAWYKGHPRSSFHTFNDGGEWLQVDKVGHAWSAYVLSNLSSAAWRSAGVSNKQSVLLGAGSSLAFLLSVEYLDGRSAKWGWSWPDVAADLLGTGLYAVQQWTGKEQMIQFKFSALRKSYRPPLYQRAGDLFGHSLPERLLKDYNRQTYWLSFNLSSLTATKRLPPWLNLSVGYGAEGMFGGFENLAKDANGNIIFDRRDIKRYRQWYLAPDIDLTRIRTGSKVLRTVLYGLNCIKFPAPSVEFSENSFKFHLITF